MLVFFSDIHLTDGTSGETINEGAFELFADQLVDLARKRQARELRLVLLGDALDIIRSSRWLTGPQHVRPWTPAGSDQERVVAEILHETLQRNRPALRFLGELPDRISADGVIPRRRVTFEYVLGNHDWLLNRYRSTREMVVRELSLPERYVEGGFPREFFSPEDEYDALARHGDIYDRLNYDVESGRDAASLGDVITIELLSRFPLEVAHELQGQQGAARIVQKLREIDNVRPYTRIGAWVAEVVSELEADNPRFVEAIRRAMIRCIGDFTRNDLFRQFAGRQLRLNERVYLRILLNQIRHRKFRVLDLLTRLAERLYTFWRLMKGMPSSEYLDYALTEYGLEGRRPRFVLYGHTHRVLIAPLPLEGNGGDDDNHRYYLNTGTWRSVWERSEVGDRLTDFASWKEMTYVVLYAPGEAHGKHEFEIWTGSLRDRPAAV